MEQTELLQKLLIAGEKMRIAQKLYYKEPRENKEIKKELLIKSKQAEKEFDNTLFNAKQLVK